MGLQRTTMMAAYPHVGTKDFYAAAAEDAARAMVADMAKALGGSVTWGWAAPDTGQHPRPFGSDIVCEGDA